ncbi:extracellular solute-binding protein [Robinsoniella peoriensis]|uniref:Galactose operon repressor n=1 Tax=Robinsoniella peoriensis TaxID=180332 RepID=A0A4U8Q0D1_9FIRM|nr:extracellular solute-binding protein [Robinsoniella peoriensis]MDU7028763.1 extracellular solute-binding protein [Clostridiales bacterium]TLC98131.1 Galactose operon repressor [Robinsoniella peoriensis]
MSTIKDVAKLAQVSIGTVSNVINGKTINEDLIQRVEQAMEQLSYRPDANARNLKITKSNMIGIILPNVVQQEYAVFLEKAESLLKSNGYEIFLKLGKNNKMIEKRAIESCYNQGVAGILFYSNIKKKREFFEKNSEAPMVVIGRTVIPDLEVDQIVIDYREAFEKALRKLKEQGMQKVGIIMEKCLLEGGGLLEIYYKYYSNQSMVKTVDSSRERGFQAFFELYYDFPELEAVIAGSDLTAQGIKKAQKMLELSDVQNIVIKESNWIEDEEEYAAQLSVPFEELAKNAAQRLITAIENPAIHEVLTEIVYATYDQIDSNRDGISKSKAKMRFAMLDGVSARSLQMLAPVYERESGAAVTLELFKYDELETLLYEHAERKDSSYDGFMLDISWLDGMVETGYVKNLDEFYQKNKPYFEGFVKNTLSSYAMYVESLYGIPFMSGFQLLFYQKDLFEDQSLKIRFKRMYGEELEPPKTWAKFNSVAEFFTKKYNPHSPVEYGVSLNQGVNVYTSINYLNHLWAYGGEVIDETGRVVINSNQAIAALRNLKKSFQYTSGEEKYSWVDIADEFKKGNSAMVILYNSDAGDINNYTKSKVAGNVGYSLIPGGTPVLGGWSLSLNAYGRQRAEAGKFLLWACSNANGIPMCLLGGSTLRKEYYERAGQDSLEPWKNHVLKSFEQSRSRRFPEISDDSKHKNKIYTKLIPREIQRVINEEISEQEAVANMEASIKKLVSDSGCGI